MKVDWKGAFLVTAFCVASAIATSAQTFTPVFKTLANFDTTNGAHPQWAPLVQGLDGAFYGTTAGGGLHESGCFRSPDDDCGVIYRITSDGTFSTLYEFTNGIDGSGPGPGLILGTDESLYGSNSDGGEAHACGQIGCGAIFKITSSGTFTTLYDFIHADSANPNSNLVQATNGMYYGVESMEEPTDLAPSST